MSKQEQIDCCSESFPEDVVKPDLEAEDVKAAAQLEADAHAAILVWCRSRCSVVGGYGAKPVMRERRGYCEVLDSSYFGYRVIADGTTWYEVLIQLRMLGYGV